MLTRFNLRTPGAEGVLLAREGWLEERMTLFERYCVPSVAAQERARARWIVYVDPDSPPWLFDRLSRASVDGLFQVIRRPEVLPEDLIADIVALCGAEPARLLTTNLDNDDALAVDFLARVQRASSTPGTAAIYLTRGLVTRGDRVYLRTDRQNAFCSVVDDGPHPLTAWFDWHNRLHEHMPVREVHGPPAWLQVVHGNNVSNRVRGRLVAAQQYSSSFPTAGLRDAPSPSAADIWGDRLVRNPVRLITEGARSTTKGVALALGGKDAIARANLAVARMREIRSHAPRRPLGFPRHQRGEPPS